MQPSITRKSVFWVFFFAAMALGLGLGADQSNQGGRGSVTKPPSLYLSGGDSLTASALKLLSLPKSPGAVFRILQIGDSHVQDGNLPEGARHYLQAKYGNAGRGFVFPYKLAKTNGPYDIQIESAKVWNSSRIVQYRQPIQAGMSGYGLELQSADDTLRLRLRGRSDYEFDKITVYYDQGADVDFFLKSPTSPARAVSLSRQAPGSATWSFDGPLASLDIQARLRQSSPGAFRLSGFSLERGGGGVLYHGVGVNGATFRSFCDQAVLSDLARLQPDLVVLSFGTNESVNAALTKEKLMANISQLISMVRQTMGAVDILLVSPGDNLIKGSRKVEIRGVDDQGLERVSYENRPCYVKNQRLPMIRDAIAEVAQEKGAAFWDFFSAMGGLGSMSDWVAQGLAAKDYIHLSARGYSLEGRLMSEAIESNSEELSSRAQSSN